MHQQSPRRRQPEPLIIPTVIEAKGASWNDETRKVATTDGQRILEALLAEYGLDGARQALTNQGFDAQSYSYVLGPLHEEAVSRRQRVRDLGD